LTRGSKIPTPKINIPKKNTLLIDFFII